MFSSVSARLEGWSSILLQAQASSSQPDSITIVYRMAMIF
jgi:hypothetical protein